MCSSDLQYVNLVEDIQSDMFDDTIEDVCGQDIDYTYFGFDKYGKIVYVNLSDINTANEREELYSRIKSSNCDNLYLNIPNNGIPSGWRSFKPERIKPLPKRRRLNM